MKIDLKSHLVLFNIEIYHHALLSKAFGITDSQYIRTFHGSKYMFNVFFLRAADKKHLTIIYVMVCPDTFYREFSVPDCLILNKVESIAKGILTKNTYIDNAPVRVSSSSGHSTNFRKLYRKAALTSYSPGFDSWAYSVLKAL